MQHKDISVFKRIFAAIEGIATASRSGEKSISCKLLYRNNNDGTPRWIWPAGISNPVFLKFYNASTPKAKAVVFIIRLLFKLRLQRLFASGEKLVYFNADDYKNFTEQAGTDWSLFTGTAGINRSALFYCNNYFFKIAAGENAGKLLMHEYNKLESLSGIKFTTLELPAGKMSDGVLQQRDIAGEGKRFNTLTDIHWLTLSEIAQIKSSDTSINSLPFWSEIEKKIAHVIAANDNRIPKGFLNKLLQLKTIVDSSTIIHTAFSHGDFTPWNIFVKDKTLGVIDWELAQNSMPCFFDAFHFLYQQASLVDHCSNEELLIRINQAFENSLAKSIINTKSIDIELHHQLYLLFIISYYAEIYSKQTLWHPQVKMSFDCWNNAMNNMLLQANQYSARELMLIDIFDFLSDKNYAALKWLCNTPSELSEESDIDLCVSKTARNELKIFLQKHPFAKSISEKRKSFMSTFTVVLCDGAIICIDAILSFKRRALIMLDAHKLLASASANIYGIRVPAVEDDFNYMWLFYLLNNSPVPERYQNHYSSLSIEESKRLEQRFVWKEKTGIRHYSEAYNYNAATKNIVVLELKKLKPNRGFSKMKNLVNYYMDTLKENFFKKGFIITFSGVDGAGKSTVIESVRHSIEKKYRRKVVVLRHRPSMLPMLSAWKEGRQAAEQKAAERLPRQGNNKSTFSSLIRFGYYYTDYLLGQFAVQIKYVWRGYVVIYDRYYFDFINDGKRSNIVLPHWFTKAWYVLLMKPAYNFFLYADPATILQRKKELDANTISKLTAQYLKLFRHLSSRHSISKYIPIENIELPKTLQTIFHHVKQQAL